MTTHYLFVGATEITGYKTFNSIHVTGDIGSYSAAGTVNGYSISALEPDTLKKSGSQIITGSKIFLVMFLHLCLLNVQRSTEINQMDFLQRSIFSFCLSHFVQNDVNFTSDVEISGTIDGLDISQQVIHLSSPKTISGRKIFTSDTYVYGDITVTGKCITTLKWVIRDISNQHQ